MYTFFELLVKIPVFGPKFGMLLKYERRLNMGERTPVQKIHIEANAHSKRKLKAGVCLVFIKSRMTYHIKTHMPISEQIVIYTNQDNTFVT